MKPKFFITTTVARSLFFFKGQPRLWKETFDVTAIAAEQDKLVRFAEEEGINHRYLPMHREISIRSDIVCLLRFIWLFFRERPMVVHGNTPKASMLSMLAAWITRRPVRIYMCHGLRYQGTEGRMRKLLMSMERLTCRCATQVLSVSNGVAEIMVRDGLCKQEKMKVLGFGSAGGIDMDWFDPKVIDSHVRNELNIGSDSFVFCFVGRIVRDKGVNELVQAFQRINEKHHDCHLILLGAEERELNPIDDETNNTIVNNGNIHALGRQPDVRPYLKASNAFVLPSYREGFGMVLIEAGAMGLPCITTNITGCNEIIIPNKNGDIIEPHNADALYAIMSKWVENRSEVCEMAVNARKMVAERYDSKKVRKMYYDEYKRLAGL